MLNKMVLTFLNSIMPDESFSEYRK